MQEVVWDNLPINDIKKFLKKNPHPRRAEMIEGLQIFINNDMWQSIRRKFKIKGRPGVQIGDTQARAPKEKIEAYFKQYPDGGTHFKFCEFTKTWLVSQTSYDRLVRLYGAKTQPVLVKKNKTGIYQTIHEEGGLLTEETRSIINNILLSVNAFSKFKMELVERTQSFEIRNLTS